MYSTDEIMQFVTLVADVVDPDKIILFGSYGYGNPDENSDLDLLVIKNGKEITIDDEAELATGVFYKKRQMGIHTRYDIFFNTDEQVRKIAERGGAFTDALQKGQVLYERSYQ